MWHIQLALVVSLLHVRYSDVLQQTEQPLFDQRHIVDVRLLDVMGIAVFLVQALALVVMKESRASIGAVQVALWVGSALHALQIARLIYITRSPGMYGSLDAICLHTMQMYTRPHVIACARTCLLLCARSFLGVCAFCAFFVFELAGKTIQTTDVIPFIALGR